jgi:hypothetical protein
MTTNAAEPRPKRSGTRTIIYIAIGVMIACLVCVVGVVVLSGGAVLAIFNAAKPLVDTSDGFMNALKSDDYAKAYDFMVPEDQQAFGGSVEAMKQVITSLKLNDPQSWAFPNISVTNNQATFKGTGTFKDGSTKNIHIDMQKSGDTWKISGFASDQ